MKFFFFLLLALYTKTFGSVLTREDVDNQKWYQTLYEKNYTLPPQDTYTIPPVLHVIWLGPSEFPKDGLTRLQKWRDLHPGWKMKFWTDAERPSPYPWMERVSVSDFSFEKLEFCYAQSENVGEKSEILRYEILYQEGGLYIDHDTEPLMSCDTLHHTYHFYSSLDNLPPYVLSSQVVPSTSLIGSSPHHPILEEVLQWLETHWDRLEKQYPGTDNAALFNRIKHRTFSALSEGIKRGACQPLHQDIVFPAETIARHIHLGTWHSYESAWSRKVSSQLERIEKKTEHLFWLLCSIAAGSCLLFFASTRKALPLLLLMILHTASANESTNFIQWMGKESEHWAHVKQPKDLEFLDKCTKIYARNICHLSTPAHKEKIPHTIHFIWLGPRPFPPESVENVRTWMAHHPDWQVKFWTDRDRDPPCLGMQKILVDSFSFTYLKDAFSQSENYGEKSDILRYEILFQEGGVYADHDANCLKPFDALHGAYDLYCCLEAPHPCFVGRNITCGNGVIGARTHHPCIEHILKWIAAHWELYGKKFRGRDGFSRNELVMNRTYIALTHAAEECLNLGENIDIVLPSAYFFAKKGIPCLYSEHFYATAWGDGSNKRSSQEKELERHIGKVEKRNKNLYTLALALCALQGIILWKFLRNKRV